ncbi:excinuclease ABC subunit UvrA [Acidaminobacter hydrogenoformans]|uniref:UvrABC system protein A n=1 Tax=Acidaminobacter hydrogenoformans DSM 2784 TaxID=1120920 RepID=A0A1G5S356_9FIRM|nr:excinuclease ABC subunit UvrA [Acidaminobacter hydrogenoformans]SCZ80753.1 Excinuclease ABC subunit A [Acidaminobacter hydrogenoformans DSM 2784]
MSKNQLEIRGAKEHNLKNIDIDIPRDELVVITGLSGSGKSSLAFDTIYAEGQRRYVESLSAYARQFLGQMEKPNVESISGLSPAISIDQKTTSRNPRSTVGTVTEIYDYLRLLYARAGTPHCPVCGVEISQQTVDQIVDRVMGLPEGTKIQVLAPVVRSKKGEHKKELESIRKEGFVRVRIDGVIREASEDIELSKTQKHMIEVVIDRLVVREGIQQRLSDSVETALKLTGDLVVVNILEGEDLVFNTQFACPEHGLGIPEMEPRMFSFNAPYGACEHCKGIGYLQKIDPELVIPNRKLSVKEGAIAPVANSGQETFFPQMIKAILDHFEESEETPVEKLKPETLETILYGSGTHEFEIFFDSRFGGYKKYKATFEGIVPNIQRRYNESQSDNMREWFSEFMSLEPCEKCHGARLKDEVLAVRFGGINIHEMTEMAVRDLVDFFGRVELDAMKKAISEPIVKEIGGRLNFLKDVGLDYLTLSRTAGTLSGGESQRIRLATQIGSGLVGVLYILDEPSIGLHQKDNSKLLKTLRNLTDIGNTLLVVEHDEETIMAADHVIDMGPGAGIHGGEVTFSGKVPELMVSETSITGQYLSGRKKVELPEKRRSPNGQWIRILGASENNLRGIDVQIPRGVMTCVTGVSGSGKSSLINEILYKSAAVKINGTRVKPGRHLSIEGLEEIDKIIDIDQSPIGRTPRSNPATYTGVFDPIRDLFARVPEAKMRGYQKGRFSFNVKGGRCEACRGDGILKIEMHFLPDVYVQCDVCKGKRYNRETLEVKYKGKSIADVLDMNVEEALAFFDSIPKIKRKIKAVHEVGLDYIKLGQPSTELSGGEAQRVKLATELSKVSTGRTLYILDEPTTGLHVADVHHLIKVLDRLVEGGNTVVIIEHNLDVIKSADYIIDLGPDGGDKGGEVVAAGTPEQVARCVGSYTGQYLRPILEKEPLWNALPSQEAANEAVPLEDAGKASDQATTIKPKRKARKKTT